MVRFWLIFACLTTLSVRIAVADTGAQPGAEVAGVGTATVPLTPASPPTPLPRLLLSPLTDNAAAGEETMDAWTSTLATELVRGGRYQVMTQSDLRTLIATEQLAQLLGCVEENCATNLARASGADFLVSGQVGLVGTSWVMTLVFLDPRSGEAKARVTRAMPATQEALALGRIADELIARAAQEPLSELALITDPPGAQVFVDGHEFGTTPLPATTLRPGVHRIVMQKEGYRPRESSLTLEPNEMRQSTFSLEPIDAQMKVSDVAIVAQEAARAGADAARKATEVDIDAVRQEVRERDAKRAEEALAAAKEAEDRSQKLIEEAEARLKAAVEEKEEHRKRRRLGGFALLFGSAILDSGTSAARSAVAQENAPTIIGLTGKVPLFWKVFLGLRVQAMPPFATGVGSEIDANETIYSEYTAPMGFVELGAGLGLHMPLAGPLFLEVAVDAGTRMTDSKRRTETSDDTYDHWYSDDVGFIAARTSLGVGLGVFELAATALVSQPLGAESALSVADPSESVIGFSTLIQMGVSVGVSF